MPPAQNRFEALYDDDDEIGPEIPKPIIFQGEITWASIYTEHKRPCCLTCAPSLSIIGSVWTCQASGKQWEIILDTISRESPHSAEECHGISCQYHPAITPEIARWGRRISDGDTWGNLWQEEEEDMRRSMSPEDKARLAAEQEAEIKAKEEQDELERKARLCERYVERTAVRVGVYRKEKLGKIMQPCKFLYACEGHPGKPTTNHVVTECWAHDYTDPVTGERKTPRICDRIHPDEPGWCKEWDGNPKYRPPTATNRFAALGSAPAKRFAKACH